MFQVLNITPVQILLLGEFSGKLLTMKWVDTRKTSGLVRSRLVVREIKKAKKEEDKLEPQEVFSSMPPVEALKALVSHMMTEQKDSAGEELVLALYDISRSTPHCQMKWQKMAIVQS